MDKIDILITGKIITYLVSTALSMFPFQYDTTFAAGVVLSNGTFVVLGGGLWHPSLVQALLSGYGFVEVGSLPTG